MVNKENASCNFTPKKTHIFYKHLLVRQMEYLQQQQPFEFVQFLDFFNTNLDDPEVTNYIQKYSDFCNFREHKCSSRVSVEKAFIKWRMSKNTPTPLVKIENEPETKKWIISQDTALPQNEIKPIMIEPCNPTSTITTATPEHMTYKQSKEAGRHTSRHALHG
jgi:hypothetical protein